MKKILFLLILLLLFFSYVNANTNIVLSEMDYETYNDYLLTFDECVLNTNNFIDKFSYFKDKEYRILEIVPYKKDNNKYLYYTKDLDYILDNFKNKYIYYLIDNNKYVNNICIKSVTINTSNYLLNDFNKILPFSTKKLNNI